MDNYDIYRNIAIKLLCCPGTTPSRNPLHNCTWKKTHNKLSDTRKMRNEKFGVWGMQNHRSAADRWRAPGEPPLPLDPLVIEFMIVLTEEDDDGDDVVKSLS